MRAVCIRPASVVRMIGLLSWLLPSFAAAAVPSPFPLRHAAAVGAVAFSPNGRTLASGGDDALLRVADVATGKERHQLRGHLGRIAAVAFSPDGKVLASGGRD